jgi:hypothetical protein
VQAIVTERRCQEIAANFKQPHGVAERRAIGIKVKASINTYAGRCLHTKDISLEAHAYLTNWVNQSTVRKTRPAQYSFLDYRIQQFKPLDGQPNFEFPTSRKHVQVTPPAVRDDDSSDGDSDAEKDANLPIDWELPD